jgi:hypothetical protein|tara:strand:- start:10150 stop:10815 length:666 start_codon:yes stop_codon:yes gene_type:complete
MPITEYGDGAVPSDFETFDVIPDSIYGSGMDGNVTISTNTTLARDMYYNNLTINPGIVLDTAGYRVFVRNNLAMAATSTNQGDTKIGRVGGVSTTGTLKGGGQAAVIDSLGGNGNGYTATAPTEGADYFNHPDIAVDGVIQHGGSTTPTALNGGAGDSVNYGGGIVVLCARKIQGYGTIEASGETTTGGGVIFIVSQDIPLTGVLTDVTGYASGTVKTFKV